MTMVAMMSLDFSLHLYHLPRYFNHSLLLAACSFSLCEVLNGSLSDIKPILGFDDPASDPDYHKLQLIVTNIFMTRNWNSHEFSVTMSECQHAIASLIELCGIMQQRLRDASLDDDFKTCVSELRVCLATVDQLQEDFISHATVRFQLRFEQAASILLLRSFERLCAAAEDKQSFLANYTISAHYNKSNGCMRYTDVVDVVHDMQQKGMSTVKTIDYEFLKTGRNMFFHGTQSNIALAMIFCTGSVARLLQYIGGPTAAAAYSCTVTELFAIFRYLQLDGAQVVQRIATSHGVALPSDRNNAEWFDILLWPPVIPCALESNADSPSAAAIKYSKQVCGAKFDAVFLRFGGSVATYCTNTFKRLKGKKTFALTDAVDVKSAQMRCDELLACMALSSLDLQNVVCLAHPFGCIISCISAGSSLVDGKRAPEQRDEFFTGRSTELKRICDVISSVLLNTPVAFTATRVAVLGLPGMGKSLLVSHAVLEMQHLHADLHRTLYFLKLRGRGASIVEEDLEMHARALGSKIAVAADSTPNDALVHLREYLSHLRFVAIIDDANADGLQAVAKWIPRSSACHAVLVTSQQPPEELSFVEASLGPFEKITLDQFTECSSVELLKLMYMSPVSTLVLFCILISMVPTGTNVFLQCLNLLIV